MQVQIRYCSCYCSIYSVFLCGNCWAFLIKRDAEPENHIWLKKKLEMWYTSRYTFCCHTRWWALSHPSPLSFHPFNFAMAVSSTLAERDITNCQRQHLGAWLASSQTSADAFMRCKLLFTALICLSGGYHWGTACIDHLLNTSHFSYTLSCKLPQQNWLISSTRFVLIYCGTFAFLMCKDKCLHSCPFVCLWLSLIKIRLASLMRAKVTPNQTKNWIGALERKCQRHRIDLLSPWVA